MFKFFSCCYKPNIEKIDIKSLIHADSDLEEELENIEKEARKKMDETKKIHREIKSALKKEASSMAKHVRFTL